MLNIIIPSRELYDEEANLFSRTKECNLCLEHSLVSLSKWESRWCKPFISLQDKTNEEILDYIKCMTLTQNVNDDVYKCLSDDNMRAINNYIEAPMTATTFSDRENKKFSREIITSELIYYWMISLNIPMECQKWHLNRLMTLIKVCSIKNQPKKKRSMREIMTRNSELNEMRKKQLNTKG